MRLSRDRKLATFIRTYLVYDGADIPDELIDLRYRASVDPQVMANPPLQRPSGLSTLLRMDLTGQATQAATHADADPVGT